MRKIIILGQKSKEKKEILKASLLAKIDNLEIKFEQDFKDFGYLPKLVILWEYNGVLTEALINKYNIIRIHPSILPAFNTSTAVIDAYKSGVKVSGVTIHRVENPDMTGLIISQYPVIIDNYTHFEGFLSEIEDLEIKLAIPTIKSILEDKIFDIVDLLSDRSQNTCGGCSGCKNSNCR